MLNNSSILVTGGTGSFGNSFIPLTLKKYNPKRLVIFSRDEMKQWEMEKLFKNDKRVRFFIGDVRDKNTLHRALHKIDFVVHAAATKIVPTAEYNPFECIKTNINGAMNLIAACGRVSFRLSPFRASRYFIASADALLVIAFDALARCQLSNPSKANTHATPVQ